MNSSPAYSSNLIEASASGTERHSLVGAHVYEGLTIVAMVLLLGSLWVF